MVKDYYKIIGVSKNSSQDEIKKAYRKLAHQHHPDKNGEGDESKFKEINEAYQILGSPEKRKQYDQFGSNFSAQGGPASSWNNWDPSSFDINIDEIFGNIFRGGVGGFSTGSRRKPRGRDIIIDLELSLEEAFRGVVKDIELRKFIKCSHCEGSGAEYGTKKKTCETCGGSGEIKQARQILFGVFSQIQTCSTCNGEGEYPEKVCKECGGDGRVRDIERISIPIPAGIDNGDMIKINGKGEEATRGGVAGNLIIKIFIKEHKYLNRKGANLYSDIEISFPKAIFGDSVEIKTIDGKVDLKIPTSTQSGTKLRLKGKGMPSRNSVYGDHFVTVKVKTPNKVSRKAKKLLEELEEELR